MRHAQPPSAPVVELLPSTDPRLGAVFVLADASLCLLLRTRYDGATHQEARDDLTMLADGLAEGERLQLHVTDIGGQREIILALTHAGARSDQRREQAVIALRQRALDIARLLSDIGIDVEPVAAEARPLLLALWRPDRAQALRPLRPVGAMLADGGEGVPDSEPLPGLLVGHTLAQTQEAWETEHWLRLGENRHAVTLVVRPHGALSSRWLARYLACEQVSVSVKIAALSRRRMAKITRQALQDGQGSDAQRRSWRHSLTALRSGAQRPYSAYVNVTVYGASADEAWARAQALKEANPRDELTLDPRGQYSAWNVSLPLLTARQTDDEHDHRIVLLTENLVALTPWEPASGTARVELLSGRPPVSAPADVEQLVVLDEPSLAAGYTARSRWPLVAAGLGGAMIATGLLHRRRRQRQSTWWRK